MAFDRLLHSLRSLDVDANMDVDPGSERIEPLLFHASGKIGYRKAYYDSAASNVMMLDARDEVCAALATERIRPVAFKGADLADRIYPSPALRPMSDIDLWVRPEEITRAEGVLQERGFRPFCPEMAPGLAQRTRHARLFVRPGAAIDLHWSLIGHGADRRAPSLEWFGDHAVETNSPYATLDATAHLLYVAAHMKLQHYDETPPLLWLADFYLLAHGGDVDWVELELRARAFGWADAVAATASEVSRRLHLALPVPLEGRPAVEALSKPAVPVKGSVERALREIATLDFRARAALVKGYLLPSSTYVKWRYRPRRAWTWPLYYFVRWARVVRGVLALSARRLRAQ